MYISLKKKSMIAIIGLLAICMVLLQVPCTAQAAVPIRKCDVNSASSGNELIGVSGTYEYVGKSKILARINTIRKEACQKGYINPANGKTLTMSDYVPIQWSSDLEWIAQLRAAEATVSQSHTRPNDTSCFSITHNGEQSWAENLAWNSTGLLNGIEQWYGEKDDWVAQNKNADTGHYESLIKPNYRYVGMGSFRRSTGGWYGISAEFSFQSEMSQAQSSLKGKRIQVIEVQSKQVGSAKIQAPASIKAGKTKQLSVIQKITFDGIMGGKNETEGTPLKSIKWSSSKKSVLAVDGNGKLFAKKAGKAVVTAKITGGKTLKATVTVK